MSVSLNRTFLTFVWSRFYIFKTIMWVVILRLCELLSQENHVPEILLLSELSQQGASSSEYLSNNLTGQSLCNLLAHKEVASKKSRYLQLGHTRWKCSNRVVSSLSSYSWDLPEKYMRALLSYELFGLLYLCSGPKGNSTCIQVGQRAEFYCLNIQLEITAFSNDKLYKYLYEINSFIDPSQANMLLK